MVLGEDHCVRSANSAAASLFGSPASELVGQSFSTMVAAPPIEKEGHLSAAEQLRATYPDGRVLFAQRSDGSILPLEAVGQPVDSTLEVRLRPLPQRTVAEGANEAPVPRTINQCIAVMGLLRLPTSNMSLERQFEHFLAVILSLRADPSTWGAAIFLVTDQGECELHAARNMPEPVLERCQRLPADSCLCGRVACMDEVVVVYPVDRAQVNGAPCMCDRTYMGIPIRSNGRLLGVLACVSASSHSVSKDEHDFLAAIAGGLGAYIQHRRVEEQNRALLEENRRVNHQLIRVLEEERRRIARELHDEMGQSLTAIKADAALIRNHCDDPSSPIHRSTSAIGGTADRLYDVIQNLLTELRPSGLDDLGLVDALHALIRRWREHRPGITCAFRTDGDLEGLGEALNITIYRIIQESLNNVIRHAAATRVGVALRRESSPVWGEELTLHVEDNGLGAKLQNLHAKRRHGLVGIRERVHGLGGEMDLDSKPGKGFRLTVRFPLLEADLHD